MRGMGKSDEAGASKDWGLEIDDRRDGGRKGVMAAHSMTPQARGGGVERAQRRWDLPVVTPLLE